MGLLKTEIAKNRSLQFSGLFHRIARASIAVSAIGLMACGSPQTVSPVSTVSPPIDPVASPPTPDGPPLSAEMTCIEGAWRPTQGWNPDRAYDHAAIYRAPCGGCAPEPQLIDSDGEACATATDRPGCEAAIGTTHRDHIFVTNAQGSAIFAEAAELNSFLGLIDTPDEALLAVFRSGHDVRCDDENVSVVPVDGGYEVWATRMTQDCDPIEVKAFHFRVEYDGSVELLGERVVSSTPGICVGRRPEGLSTFRAPSHSLPLARFFAEITQLEESAVTAFERLAQELRQHGAPAELVDACLDAARDETRHTQQMGSLARRFGAQPSSPVISDPGTRTLFQIAQENAVEGCVRETYGALIGVHQSLTAKDQEIREVMHGVAADETRHSELSWKVAAWIEPLLTDEERRSIQIAQRRAISELRSEMSAVVPSELVEQAGVPEPQTALHMLDQLTHTLFTSPS